MSSIRFALVALVVFVSIPFVLADNPPTTQPAKVPVDFHAMQALLPETAAGVARSNLGGNNSTMGDLQLSNATADYSKPDSDGKDAHASLTVTDYGAAPQMVAGLAAWRLMPINMQSDDGFQRTVKVKTYPAFETYTKDGDSRQMIVLLADRYLLTLDTTHVTEADFKTLVDSLPLDQLAQLK